MFSFQKFSILDYLFYHRWIFKMCIDWKIYSILRLTVIIIQKMLIVICTFITLC
nr:MAG TPA: hypothetical protein [Caudoviricetes sp.]